MKYHEFIFITVTMQKFIGRMVVVLMNGIINWFKTLGSFARNATIKIGLL
jgi:hypothetical protein